jgi:hypothetical protein
MPGFLDLVDAVNVLARVEALIGAIFHNTRRSPEVTGIAALPSAHEIRVSRDGDWTGVDVVNFLSHYGVDVWGGRTSSNHFIMYVKERQANWAEYLLRRRGVPVESPVINPRNLLYAAEHAPGDQPPAWADGSREGGPGAAPDFLDKVGRLLG